MQEIEKYKNRFWHELSQDEVIEIIKIKDLTVGDFLENIKPPEWCGYPDALLMNGMGCMSLCSTSKKGGRISISAEWCKDCDSFKK